MRNIILLLCLVWFSSCKTQQKIIQPSIVKKSLDILISVGEKEKMTNNNKDSYLTIYYHKLTQEEIDFQNINNLNLDLDKTLSVSFIQYKYSYPKEIKYKQYIYNGYTVILLENSKIVEKEILPFLTESENKKIDYNSDYSILYNPTNLAIFYNKEDVIQIIDPWKLRKKIRYELQKNGIKVNTNSSEIYAKFSKEDIEQE